MTLTYQPGTRQPWTQKLAAEAAPLPQRGAADLLPEPWRTRGLNDDQPWAYQPSPELVEAMNVALILGKPLLLTGEPGAGKTCFAFSVAWELGFGPPLKFEAKSDSTARDLFYQFDLLGLFKAAQTGIGSRDPLDHITYNALGLAMIYSLERGQLADLIPPDFEPWTQRRSVVLIDELDKAPRDFPNDILNELECMYFKIPELNHAGDGKSRRARIDAAPSMRPIVIITSNSEKQLPAPFMRRCIYYDLPFPGRNQGETLGQIVQKRLGHALAEKDPLLEDALDLFYHLRTQLSRPPATAELMDWLRVLNALGFKPEHRLHERREQLPGTLTTLVKDARDRTRIDAILKPWFEHSS